MSRCQVSRERAPRRPLSDERQRAIVNVLAWLFILLMSGVWAGYLLAMWQAAGR